MNSEPYETKTESCLLDVVVPVYNESRTLRSSIRTLRDYLDEEFPFDATVTIADNASTDDTWEIACELATELAGVRALHLEEKGRGRALRAAWTRSDAVVLAYMDVDLSTGLDALFPLVAPIASGHSELAIGTRLAKGSRIVRGPRRELISRTYNAMLRSTLHASFSDAQCGFKAIRGSVARTLLPSVADDEWFFDTELLVLAERNGLRIHEVPVDWSDDPDSRVHLRRTALADLKGIIGLLARFGRGRGYVEAIASRRRDGDLAELGRFGGLRILNPLLFFSTYISCFVALATALNDYLANLIAVTTCTASTYIAHRVAQRHRPERLEVESVSSAVLAMCISVIATTWSLAAAIALGQRSFLEEVVALLAGASAAGGASFLIRRASTLHVSLRASTFATCNRRGAASREDSSPDPGIVPQIPSGRRAERKP